MKEIYLCLATCLAFAAVPIHAQETIYGPTSEPPGGVFTEINGTPNDNLIGTTEGKIFTFSAIDFLERTDVFYGTVKDSIKLSLDGADFASGDTALMEVLQFSEILSNPTNGSLIWTGITEIPDQPGVPVYTRLVMSFTSEGAPMELISAASLGLDPYVGAVPDLTPGITFKVTLQFQASFNQVAGFVPHIQFYDQQSLTDGRAYSSYGWGWYWVNSAPLVDNNETITVNEGDTATVRNQFFAVSDVESGASQLVLEMMDPQLPAHGMFLLNGAGISAGGTFTAEDIANELLEYAHDGSETTMDSIALRLKDADDAYYAMGEDTTFYLKFMVTPVDDLPEVEVNAMMTTTEEAEETISNDHLLTSDSESADENITYTLDPDGENIWPKSGLIRRAGVPLSSGGKFTQADLNAGRISYKHDGSETAADGFVFSVVDEFGHPADNEGSANFFFEISITLVNDLPQFTKNVATDVLEWEVTTITSSNLTASDDESPNSEVTFTLVQDSQLPAFGYIEVDGADIGHGGSFTMQDILDGAVKYVETRNADEATDAIVFRITDGDGGMAKDGEFTDFKHTFNITQTSARDALNDQISFYPNPGDGFFMISGAEKIGQLSVYNILGRKVFTAHGKDLLQGTMDLSDKDEGVYMLRITTLDGVMTTRRLVIR